MQLRIFQKGFNFSQDGPGNRLVYHLSGCNLHCPWCSNADGMASDAGICYPLEQLVDECVRCRPMFFSGGGVTFTGGEATMQFEPLLELLQRLRAQQIHTAIETNGTCRRLPELAQWLDYLIMDLKHYDPDVLKQITGVGNETVLENLGYFCRNSIPVHIRIPLINGFNALDPEGFVRSVSQFDTSQTVFEFLPYHEYGKDKWKGAYRIENGFVSPEVVEEFTEAFRRAGLRTVRT